MVVLVKTISLTFLGIDCIGYVFLKRLPSNSVFLCTNDRNELVVLRTETKFGDRSFSVSGPATSNVLSHYMRNDSTVHIFKSTLITHLL